MKDQYPFNQRALSRSRTLDLLNEITDDTGIEFRSLYLPPHLPSSEIRESLKEVTTEQENTDKLAELASRSMTGSVIFYSPEHTYLILPPFPITVKYFVRSLNTEPLLSLLKQDYMIGLILVRLGAYAIGLCHGDNLIRSKVGTGLVHGRHKKGGSSAHRFERHRDKQIEYFLTRVCQRTREQLESHVKSLDYLVYGGARTTIQLLKKQCAFVGKLDIETLPPLFDIPEPRQSVLQTAVNRIWSSTVMEWQGN